MHSDHTLNALSEQPETRIIPLSQGKFAIVDAADFKWLSQWKWTASRDGNTWYAKRNPTLPDGKRKTVRMHREILGVGPEYLVDHVNLNGLDNRRVNLRIATKSANSLNRSAPSNNSSGYKGVSWNKRHNQWYAHIAIHGKRSHLGHFEEAEAAARAYDDAARRLYGEFAKTNFVLEVPA